MSTKKSWVKILYGIVGFVQIYLTEILSPMKMSIFSSSPLI